MVPGRFAVRDDTVYRLQGTFTNSNPVRSCEHNCDGFLPQHRSALADLLNNLEHLIPAVPSTSAEPTTQLHRLFLQTPRRAAKYVVSAPEGV